MCVEVAVQVAVQVRAQASQATPWQALAGALRACAKNVGNRYWQTGAGVVRWVAGRQRSAAPSGNVC